MDMWICQSLSLYFSPFAMSKSNQCLGPFYKIPCSFFVCFAKKLLQQRIWQVVEISRLEIAVSWRLQVPDSLQCIAAAKGWTHHQNRFYTLLWCQSVIFATTLYQLESSIHIVAGSYFPVGGRNDEIAKQNLTDDMLGMNIPGDKCVWICGQGRIWELVILRNWQPGK